MIVEVIMDWHPACRFTVCGNHIRGVVPPQFRHLVNEYPPHSTREGFLRAAIKGGRNKRDLTGSGNGLRIRARMPETEDPAVLPDPPPSAYRYPFVDMSRLMVV